MRDSCLKIFINEIILQFIFYQNSNTSKSCFVASDESFVSFSYINEQYRKKRSFLQTGRSAFFLQKYVWNVLEFKENQVKIKNAGCIDMLSCDVIEIFNCKLRHFDSFPSGFFLLLKTKKSFQFLGPKAWHQDPPLKPPMFLP